VPRFLPILALLACRAPALDEPGETGVSTTPTTDDADSGEPEECVLSFPALPDEPSDTGTPEDTDTGEPLPTLDTTSLIAHWSLDGDWRDAVGGYDLTPLEAGGFSDSDAVRGGSNQAYGPTGRTTGNGATTAALTDLDLTEGVTLEGWVFKTNHDTGGVLFGFGDSTWGTPSLVVSDSWGLIAVTTGTSGERSVVRFPRAELGCWNHVALTVAPGGTALTLYVNGVAQEPSDGEVTPGTDAWWGEPFQLGTFSGTYGDEMRIDEVRVWERELAEAEVGLAATPTGPGPTCPGASLAWEPGPRCEWSEARPSPVMPGEVRVLTDDTVVIVRDPNPWLVEQLREGCGTYLEAMETAMADGVGPAEWWAAYQRRYAWLETQGTAMPDFVDALAASDHFLVDACDTEAQPPLASSHWPVATREPTLQPLTEHGTTERIGAAEVVWHSTLTLPHALEPGEVYAFRDAWGNRLDLDYDLDTTVSWLIKLDQEGYLADAPSKYAYLGAWIPQEGALDLSRFDGAPFEVVDASSREVAFTGTITFRAEDALSGESVYELDFSALDAPGEYYLRVPGAGRSHGFELGQDAVGRAFYTYARGLYHNRCGTDLEAEHTAWTRGDIHTTYRGGFPPDSRDYADHAAEGWGFLDEQDQFVAYSSFQAVAATATTEELPLVKGGWHDAGDFDRRTFHLRAVQDLVVTWRMFPGHFTDGQLQIPESGNGVPDLLDEAVWGVEFLRQAQTAEGGVGTWVEATSHPHIADPGLDTQPYYLSLPTRNASLQYAAHAAQLGRALVDAGDATRGQRFIDSAVLAYAYGTDPDRRVTSSWTTDTGATHRFVEAPTLDSGRVLEATLQLWLATEDPTYRTALDVKEPEFRHALANLWWQGRIFTLVDFALEGSRLPAGWGEDAREAITRRADTFADAIDDHAFRKAWYPEDHGYFTLSGWGNGLYMPMRSLVAAWHLTEDSRYRRAALLGLNHLHGANPMGRVHVTGLGDHGAVTALHLPSWVDTHDEPVPGIPLYGPGTGMPWVAATRVYGLYEDARSDPAFEGLAQPLMPPPWDNTTLEQSTLTDTLVATLPPWRRFIPLESQVVPSMEFTVWETTSIATAVTGALMGPGWMPGPNDAARVPRTEAELSSDLWMGP
jgi:endoglucanase